MPFYQQKYSYFTEEPSSFSWPCHLRGLWSCPEECQGICQQDKEYPELWEHIPCSPNAPREDSVSRFQVVKGSTPLGCVMGLRVQCYQKSQHRYSSHTSLSFLALSFGVLKPSGSGGSSVLSHVWLFEILWTAAHQAPLSMDPPGKITGMGCHFLLPGMVPTRGLKAACLLQLLHWQVGSVLLSHLGSLLKPSNRLLFLGYVHFDLASHFIILNLCNHGASVGTTNVHMLLQSYWSFW